MSGVRLSRGYLPGMLQRRWGRVVFVSSELALNIPAEMVHYGMTKLAQLGVARGLAESIPGSGVTVNSVLPGPKLTPALEAFMSEMIGDEAASEEVANLIVYLCSSQA